MLDGGVVDVDGANKHEAARRLGLASGLRLSVDAMTGVPWLLDLYACVASIRGDHEKALRLFAASGKGRERLAVPRRPAGTVVCERFERSASEAVPADRRAVLENEGRQLPLRRALRYAKGEA